MISKTRWIQGQPTPKQAVFLSLDNREALYGGAGGGGKSWANLAAAAMYLDHPKYRAIIFRRTFKQLSASGGVIELSKQWWSKYAHYDRQEHLWTFPSGATLRFSHLQYDKDCDNHQSARYDYMGFDEACQFTPYQLGLMPWRVRQDADVQGIPERIRYYANPGGDGHNFIKGHFGITKDGIKSQLSSDGTTRIFVTAFVTDNPYQDQSYINTLNALPYVERERYLHGNWEIAPSGGMFKAEWWGDPVPALPINDAETGEPFISRCRFWDIAATEGGGDYTVGVLMSHDASTGLFVVEDVIRGQWGSGRVMDTVIATAATDPYGTIHRIERQPSAGGKHQAEDYERAMSAYDFHAIQPQGNKAARAGPLAASLEHRNVKCASHFHDDLNPLDPIHMARADYISEITAFNPTKTKQVDDCLDATSGAYNELHDPYEFSMVVA